MERTPTRVALYTDGHSGNIDYMQTELQEWLRIKGACLHAREQIGATTFEEALNVVIAKRQVDYYHWACTVLGLEPPCTCDETKDGSLCAVSLWMDKSLQEQLEQVTPAQLLQAYQESVLEYRVDGRLTCPPIA